MNVLAIGCHPDDCEINCTGTLLKCAQRGDKVTICHVANGNLGHVQIMPDELRKIRAQEAQNAGKVAGFEVISLDVGDLRVYEWSLEQLNAVVDLIRKVQPDFIITHAPDDYMMDHRSVSKLVFDASFIASVPHYESKEMTPSKVVPIYYMENSVGLNFNPTEYVDISDVIDTKAQMLKCHESQYVWLKDHDGIDVEEQMRTISRFRGFQCGATYAEGFTQCYADGKVLAKRLLP